MEYQKISNVLDNTSNQPSKFMLRSSLCDYSDTYILVKGNISVNNTAADGAAANNTKKSNIQKLCSIY